MCDEIKELLEQKSFDEILRKYGLYKYELISGIRNELYKNPGMPNEGSSLNPDEQAILMNIYLEHASMFNIENEKVMLVSDTHMKSRVERLDYFRYVLDYCEDQGIRYLIHGGDIADGTYIKDGKSYSISFDTTETIVKDQVDYILSNYPTSSKVKQYVLSGNHDERYTYPKSGVDILKILAQYKGIYPLGPLQAFGHINGQLISLEHRGYNCPALAAADSTLHDFTIRGHSHKNDFSLLNTIYLPALSDNDNNDKNDVYHKKMGINILPGFTVMEPIETEYATIFKCQSFYFDNIGHQENDEKKFTLKKKI